MTPSNGNLTRPDDRRTINLWLDGITVTTLWPSLSIRLTVTKKAQRG